MVNIETVSLVYLFWHFRVVVGVTVCETYSKYDKVIGVGYKKCYNNLDSESTPEEIVSRWGFGFREYDLITQDGYKLTIFRVFGNVHKKTPVVLAHGILMNSLAFMTRGSKSYAYFLASEGYDVWLINFRGTEFSKGHVNLSHKNPQYWKTGFHEMAIYDLASTMDLIYSQTQRKAIYIGYSMGTTIGYIFNIKEPALAEKTIKAVLSLAPIVYFDYARSALIYYARYWPVLKPIAQMMWHGELMPRTNKTGRECIDSLMQMELCEVRKSIAFGIDLDQLDMLTYPVTATKNPDSVPVGVVDHYVQCVLSKKFQEYDFGFMGNLRTYGKYHPPEYDLSKLSIPIVIIVAPNDIVATPNDGLRLFNQLPEKAKGKFFQVSRRKFSHTDFLLARDIKELLFDDMLYIIQKYEVL